MQLGHPGTARSDNLTTIVHPGASSRQTRSSLLPDSRFAPRPSLHCVLHSRLVTCLPRQGGTPATHCVGSPSRSNCRLLGSLTKALTIRTAHSSRALTLECSPQRALELGGEQTVTRCQTIENNPRFEPTHSRTNDPPPGSAGAPASTSESDGHSSPCKHLSMARSPVHTVS